MTASQQTTRSKFTRRATPRQRTIAALIFFAIAAGFTAVHLLARFNISPWPFPCGFKQRFNLPCPTCGMTTAILAFAQGKILHAFYTQPAAAFLCAALLVTALFAFIIAVFGVYFRFLDRLRDEFKLRYVVLALLIIVAAAWAVTLSRAFVQRLTP